MAVDLKVRRWILIDIVIGESENGREQVDLKKLNRVPHLVPVTILSCALVVGC